MSEQNIEKIMDVLSALRGEDDLRQKGGVNMGKKYIVEIGRLERLYKAYVNGNGKPNLTWLSTEVDLTPYTEPDLEQVRKEAYEDGFKNAVHNCPEGCPYVEHARNEAYQRGYETAKHECEDCQKIRADAEQELADKAYQRGYENGFIAGHLKAEKSGQSFYEDGYQRGLADAWDAARKICTNWVLSDSVLSEIFGMDKTIDDIMKESTASEAIEKIRQYEQEKEDDHDREKVVALADDIGIHKLYALVREIRGE